MENSDALGPSLITASLNKLYSKDSVLTADDICSAQQFKIKSSVDLVNYMGVDELVRGFMFRLASRLYRSAVLGVLEGILKACGHTCTDVEGWVTKECDVRKDDPEYRQAGGNQLRQTSSEKQLCKQLCKHTIKISDTVFIYTRMS
jgi:hypothetical protein